MAPQATSLLPWTWQSGSAGAMSLALFHCTNGAVQKSSAQSEKSNDKVLCKEKNHQCFEAPALQMNTHFESGLRVDLALKPTEPTSEACWM